MFKKHFASLIILIVFCSTLMVAVAEARVVVRERNTYYTVTGNTGQELSRSIIRRGPKLGGRNNHAIATTTVKIGVRNIKAGVKGRSCVLTSWTVNLDLTYRYPKWRNSKRASAKVRKAWDGFFKRIVVHEEQHGKIAKDQARDIDRALRRLKGRVSRKCTDFGRNAARTFKRLLRTAERRHAWLDRRDSSVFSRVRRLQRTLHRSK